MQIDLNNPRDFTFDNVRKLLASGRNDRDMQVRVNKDGIAFLSTLIAAEKIEDLAFRLHTMDAGNDFIGPEAKAAKDPVHVAQVFYCLKRNWPTRVSAEVDVEPYEFTSMRMKAEPSHDMDRAEK